METGFAGLHPPPSLSRTYHGFVSERTFRFDIRFEKFVRHPYVCLRSGGMAARYHSG